MPWLVALGLTMTTHAQVTFARSTEHQVLFGGVPQSVEVSLHNAGTNDARLTLSFRLWRPLASTAAPLGEARSCGKITVPAGATITRTVSLTVPEEAPAEVLVQWITDGTKALGAERVTVVRPDALKELSVLAGQNPLLLHDPENALKPLLQQVNVKFVELRQPRDVSNRARLAILGPFSAPSGKMPPLPVAVRKALRRVPAVIAPQTDLASAALRGKVVELTREAGRVEVLFPAGFLNEPATRARSQLRLLELVRLSLLSASETPNPSGL